MAAALAHPLWLVERWISKYGLAATRSICQHDQQVPHSSLRLYGDPSTLESELREEGVELLPGALLRSARRVASGEVTRTRAYREGRVFIQDEGSQLIALLVGRGRRILDCCAAPGGKTAVIAARNPTATILAAELHQPRAELVRRLVRAQNVEVITADAASLPIAGHFDRVLADVPCSGTGTLARNPEIKWRLRPQELAELHAKQVRILGAALERLSPAGRAVYSSCSLEAEECEEVVDEVLRGRRDLRLVSCREELQRLEEAGELLAVELDSLVRGPFLRTLPGVHPCDGFFAALIQRD
jgi:16S rRNA (cytosine967-C5)-methyltransferase